MRVDDVRHGRRRRRRRRRRVPPREEDTAMEDAMAHGEERVVGEQMADEETVEERNVEEPIEPPVPEIV